MDDLKAMLCLLVVFALLGGCVSSSKTSTGDPEAVKPGGGVPEETGSATSGLPEEEYFEVAQDKTGPYSVDYYQNGTWDILIASTVGINRAGQNPSEWWKEFQFDETQERIVIELNYTGHDPTEVIDVALAAPGWAICQGPVCVGHDTTGPVGLSEGWYRSENSTVGSANGYSQLEITKDEILKWKECGSQCQWKAMAQARFPLTAQVNYELHVKIDFVPADEE